MKRLMCNLKSGKTFPEIQTYIEKLSKIENKEFLVIFPSFIYIPLFDKTNIIYGTQDVSISEEENATGEVTASQIKSTKANYVIVGHSERRKKFSEDDYIILKKIKNALKEDLNIIYCIGETKEERLRLKTYQILEKQIAKIYNHLSIQEMQKITIAYEPIWAIGSGSPANAADVKEIVLFIKKLITEYYGIDSEVLYGGSVNSDNIELFNEIDMLDGFLVGKASSNAAEVIKMLQKLHKN